MSQPPSGQLPPWERPQWQADGSDPVAASGQQQYGAPEHQQYGQPQYGQPQYGQPQYGQPPYGQQYGAPQYGAPQYGAPQYGQAEYGQPQFGQPPYGQPYGQLPYGEYAYPYAAPPRSTRKVLLWCLAGGLALVVLVVGIVVLIDATASPDSTVPAPAATRDPTGLGSDPDLDRLARECHDGAMAACDDLYTESELDSEYEDYGDTCAGRREGGAWAFCTDVYSDTAGSTTD